MTTEKPNYTLRLASGMCFIGHGAFGIITKKVWLNYFAVFGIGPAMGYHLMPWLGTVDILIGLSILFYPTRIALWWLVIWGAVTALLRPLSGEPFAEAIERAGNYGAPLALLALSALGSKSLFSSVDTHAPVNEDILKRVKLILRIVVVMLLAAHGWLNLIGKKGLMDQYTALGFANPAQVAHIAGIFELAAAALVLIKPLRPILIISLFWKMGTELFYPHWEVFEWIERGGSYGSILALWMLLGENSASSVKLKLAGTGAALLLSALFLTGLYAILPQRATAKDIRHPYEQLALERLIALDKKSTIPPLLWSMHSQKHHIKK